MTPETEPHPIPDPRKLQPEGLSNRAKRWMFLGAMGIVVLIVLANIVGSPPVAPAVRTQPTASSFQQQNPTTAQLDDYARNLAGQQAALLDKTRTDAANLQRLQAAQGGMTADDLQKAAALREASEVRQQFERTSGASSIFLIG